MAVKSERKQTANTGYDSHFDYRWASIPISLKCFKIQNEKLNKIKHDLIFI